MPLFQWGRFKSAAGLDLNWKIECDALHSHDWACIAHASAKFIGPFGRAIGVPRGGLQLADAFGPLCDPASHRLLIVDDVWTTGASMNAFADSIGAEGWTGFVAFARGELPPHVACFANINV